MKGWPQNQPLHLPGGHFGVASNTVTPAGPAGAAVRSAAEAD